MKTNRNSIGKIDRRLTVWMARNGILFLRISIGIVFIWFGSLKFFDGVSPAQGLAVKTIDVLTFHLFSDKTIIIGLAILEVLIGIGLLINRFLRETLLLLYLQMLGTFTPLILFTNEVFTSFPLVLSMEGQYIIKNVIIVSAGIVLGATVRGGRLDPEPVEATTT